jgi:hypothetical protein
MGGTPLLKTISGSAAECKSRIRRGDKDQISENDYPDPAADQTSAIDWLSNGDPNATHG